MNDNFFFVPMTEFSYSFAVPVDEVALNNEVGFWAQLVIGLPRTNETSNETNWN